MKFILEMRKNIGSKNPNYLVHWQKLVTHLQEIVSTKVHLILKKC